MAPYNDDVESNEYAALPTLTHEEAVRIIATGTTREVSQIPVAVSLFDEDFEWAQALCVELSAHVDSAVRGNAVLSLGHLARRFRKLDVYIVEPIYLAALRDADEYVSSQADDMVDEIRHHLGLRPDWPYPAS